jgi:hypothetical protein
MTWQLYQEYFAVIGEKAKVANLMLPILADASKWICVDIDTKEASDATVYSPGWNASLMRPKVEEAIRIAVEKARQTLGEQLPNWG